MYYFAVVVLFNRYKSLFSIQATSKTEMAKSILDGLLPPDLRDKYRIGKYKVCIKTEKRLHKLGWYLLIFNLKEKVFKMFY